MNLGFDYEHLATPCYVVDKDLIERNLRVLKSVKDQTGCKILLALKGFAMHSVFDLCAQYLDGVATSSLNEALLGTEKFGKEVHVYEVAYSAQEFPEILANAHHIVFNSYSQWLRFKKDVETYNKNNSKKVSCGLRINPHYSEVKVDKYNPCGPNSRFGVPVEQLKEVNFEGLSGLHFHAMCEQNSDVLQRILAVVEKTCTPYFDRIKWINFGGGHHITRPDYDIKLLVDTINGFRSRHDLQVYLEPGEAIALNTGYLISSVLDLTHNGMDIALMDVSATAHMPDVLEMPYRPEIIGGKEPGKNKFTYKLGGTTCLSGDVIGDYSFNERLELGDKLIFMDMAHYSMVKNTTFNGVNLPDIVLASSRKNTTEVIRSFGYEDYRNRLS